MSTKTYRSPRALKQALEDRLRRETFDNSALMRRRQHVIFGRFLARATQQLNSRLVLKGGLVLELRLSQARSTKDMDLALLGSPQGVLELLQEAGQLEMADFMSFTVQRDPRHPTIDGEGMRYEGQRFRVECALAGKIYGRPFGVDVAPGAPLLPATEQVLFDDGLEFAGVEPAHVLIYPTALHIAEKLHAYTLPRNRLNTRIKDLPDLALLGLLDGLEMETLRRALHAVFNQRATHELPPHVPEPPAEWSVGYAELVAMHQLQWGDLEELMNAVRDFLDPILGTLSGGGQWSSPQWAWVSGAP